jgi:hypothetical protein
LSPSIRRWTCDELPDDDEYGMAVLSWQNKSDRGKSQPNNFEIMELRI